MRIIVGYYVAVMALAALAACAGPRAYEGPRGAHPRVEITSRFQLDSITDPKVPTWVERYTGHLVNPTDRTVTVWVDCPTFVDTITVPPRGVQDFLVEPSNEPGVHERPACTLEER